MKNIIKSFLVFAAIIPISARFTRINASDLINNSTNKEVNVNDNLISDSQVDENEQNIQSTEETESSDNEITTKQVRPNPDGSVELPGKDGKLNAPNNVDNPVVKAADNGDASVNPGGSVTINTKGDGKLTFRNNPNFTGTITIPGGSTIYENGKITTPSGGVAIANSNGVIELPGQDGQLTDQGDVDSIGIKAGSTGDATLNPDGSITINPDGTGEITFPNNPNNNAIISIPGGSTVKPNGDIVIPEGKIVRPNPDGTITLPGSDDSFGTEDDIVIKPEGDSVINVDGSVTIPGGEVTFANGKGGMVVPKDTVIEQNGLVTAPNGDKVKPNIDGTITIPGFDKEFGSNDDGVIYPNGNVKPILNQFGAITLPEGGVVKFPGMADCEITVQPKGIVANTGVVTNPGKDGIVETDDDEILNPSEVCVISEVKPTEEPKVTVTSTETPKTGVSLLNGTLAVILAIATSLFVCIKRKK